jgi:excisionase family DNA binding protein
MAVAGEAGPAVDGVLTVAEVAGALRVSKMTVYRLVHSGAMDALRIGGAIRVPEAALANYLAAAEFSQSAVAS